MNSLRIKSIFLTVFLLFAVSLLISVLVYPEIFITFRTSFLSWSDYCVEYSLAFILINFFYQGDVQLWDYYGQMPLTFAYVTYGFFNFPNVVTAFLYVVLAPFSENSAQLFHHVFAWGNLFSGLFLRLVGIFLLLTCVTKNRWIVLAGTVMSAVFLSPAAFMWGLFRMGFVPLFMFFILRLFQTFELKYLAAIVVLFSVSLVNGVLLTTGYIYFAIHFFAMACLVWSVIFNRQGWTKFKGYFKDLGSYSWLKNLLLLIILIVLLIGPYVYMVKFTLHDVAFDADNSRISQMFSPGYYFTKMDISLIDTRRFFSDQLNFDRLTNPSVFFGMMIFFLAATGLVVSRNPLKWVFGFAILSIWLLNHPRDTLNIGLIAHWFNVLTNPLKTILRDYATISRVVLGYLLLPLAAMGAEEIIRLTSQKSFLRSRWNAVAIIMIVLAWTSIPLLSSPVRVYIFIVTLIIVAGIVWLNVKNSAAARLFFTVAICFLTIVDVAIIVNYAKKFFLSDGSIRPAVLDASPQSGSVGFEFENPKIVPFREFFTTHFSLHDDGYVWFPRGIGADFRHMTNQTLNFLYINGHSPRHVTFEKWIHDPEMHTYVEHNKRTVFMARQAIHSSPGALGRICSAGLARDVIMVDDPLGTLKLSDQWTPNLGPGEEETVHLKSITGTLSENPYYHVEGDLVIFKFDLPDDFPKHMATTWFKDDQKYLRFRLQLNENNWIEFSQVQGQLIRPYTFDVQNIKEGKLMMAISRDDLLAGRPFSFHYPAAKDAGVMGLWRSQYDHLGMDYRVKKSGWIVFHVPYDKKWKITVDGQAVDYYRVNKSFIGFPIGQGDHKILIQYWPHTSLRFWILISAILATLGLPVLIFFALRWTNENFQQLR